MKILPMVGIGCLLSLCQFTWAADKPQFVNPTFQDILRRVNIRDKESQAIIQVQGKPDIYGSFAQSFSIEEIPHSKEVVVALSRGDMARGTIVYEQYRLHIDEAIALELLHQKQMRDNEAKRQQKLDAEGRKWHEDQARKIEQLTGGTLKFGMSRKEIEKIKGKPISVEVSPLNGLVQSAVLSHYYFTLIYPDMELKFDRILVDVKVANALVVPEQKEPTPTPSSSTTPSSGSTNST